jgi:hypothetical protein
MTEILIIFFNEIFYYYGLIDKRKAIVLNLLEDLKKIFF